MDLRFRRRVHLERPEVEFLLPFRIEKKLRRRGLKGKRIGGLKMLLRCGHNSRAYGGHGGQTNATTTKDGEYI